jgi:hypothetical protein
MPRQRKTLPYMDLQRLIGSACLPNQLIKRVWGLGRQQKHVDMSLVSSNLTLMAMDAPEVIPAGSMVRREYRYADAIAFERRESVQPREGGPWSY